MLYSGFLQTHAKQHDRRGGRGSVVERLVLLMIQEMRGSRWCYSPEEKSVAAHHGYQATLEYFTLPHQNPLIGSNV